MADEPVNPPPARKEPALSNLTTALILVVITAAMFLAAWLGAYLGWAQKPPDVDGPNYGGWSYIAVMAMMILFMIVLGLRHCGRPAGILINERNLISLARFQIVIWTVIILSAFLTAAIARIFVATQHKLSLGDALNIGLDEKLWGLLGISTASLIGTPLIQSTKKIQTADPKELVKTEAAFSANGTPESKETIEANSQGVLYANAEISDAAFTDMFEGDEVSNTAYIDMPKVQMFFFTIVAAVSYGSDLVNWINGLKSTSENPLASFPILSGGLIAILGISHAGFLTGKAATRTVPETKTP
jgi:hypothetical protein